MEKKMLEDIGPSNFKKVSRRGFLGVGSVALAAGLGSKALGKEPVHSGSDPGPQNLPLDGQNPDSVFPPSTDSGSVPTFKYPFSFANKRLHDGGWSREVTVRELPISKTIAGVDMRLTAGGVRELHWHNAAEWGLMLYGNARLTALDNEGKAFVEDVHEGDLWFFPTGLPHSIQGLEPDGTEFLLVFNDGNFSEFGTVLLSDTMRTTPDSVLAKNFQNPEDAFKDLPKHELFIFQARVPGSLEDDRKAVAGAMGLTSRQFVFRKDAPAHEVKTKGGGVRIVDSTHFKESKAIAMAMVTVHPGGLRELHWHPNADEWQYYIKGKGRMTINATGGHARTMDFALGDVGYVQQTLPHYIENTGDDDLVFLEMFAAPHYQDFSASEWLTHVPPELVLAHLKISPEALKRFPTREEVVLPT